ncbi:MAG: response regulator, partial [Desulfobulbia bacterium]
MATNILLVDDHPLFRKGLLHLLEEQDDFRIIGEAGDGQAAIDKVKALSPDVVIMDISMPDMDGIRATRQILSEVPSVKVVALSMHSSKRFVEDILQAGAVGYILKGSVPEDLVKGLRLVIRGDIYLSPAITGIVVSEFTQLLDKLPSEKADQTISPLIRTKFRRHPLSSDLVSRSKLVERLGHFHQRPLTLISAAAGYGKSTLASLWLEAWGGPCGWLSLDESDSDLNEFVNYLLEAISIAIPEACETTRSFFQGGQASSIATISQH